MQSMTGFANVAGEAQGRHWRWEIKSVNGRGLDLRFRIADALGVQEAALRAVISKQLSRGSLTVQLWEDTTREDGALHLNEAALSAVVEAMSVAETSADASGLSLTASSAADILSIKGVMEKGGEVRAPDETLTAAVMTSFKEALSGLVDARTAEGERLSHTLAGLVDQIEDLSADAAKAYEHQQDGAADRLSAKLTEFVATEVDPARLAQELALLAVKADVREELDRLETHVSAARDLLAATGPVGRKLDFLTQEFNREVNTLCSKSGSAELTRIGLEMKVIVDQVREQAQNVE